MILIIAYFYRKLSSVNGFLKIEKAPQTINKMDLKHFSLNLSHFNNQVANRQQNVSKSLT